MIWKTYKRLLLFFAKHFPNNLVRVFLLRSARYEIGGKTYIAEDLVIIDELEKKGKVTIEDHATLAPRVTLVTRSFPNGSTIVRQLPTAQGPILIKKNAWIGAGVIILPNVVIGEGAVVGAGSIVTKSVPPFTIVAGTPARIFRSYSVSD